MHKTRGTEVRERIYNDLIFPAMRKALQVQLFKNIKRELV